jgi:dodecin
MSDASQTSLRARGAMIPADALRPAYLHARWRCIRRYLYSIDVPPECPARAAPKRGDFDMSDHVYKQIELTGSSTVSSDEAIRCAIARASKTLRNLHWFEVTETRGLIEGDKVMHWQVTIKVGLRIDE